jgi:hypothetical protein
MEEMHTEVFWVGERQRKRVLGITRHGWEDNIKIDFKEILWGVDWIDLVQVSDSWLAGCLLSAL